VFATVKLLHIVCDFTVNTEKLALYSLLSVACGAVAILLVIVVLLRCRRHRRRPAESVGDGSRDALNATGSGNVYTPSPASSDDNRHVVPEGGGAWWSRDDEAKSQSGSLNHPSAATTATVSRRFPATSGNGWMTSESDAASLEMGGNTSTSRYGLSTVNNRDRSGRVMPQDTDDESLMIRNERPLAGTGYSTGQAEMDGGGSWCNNGGVITNADGTVGTLGRSFTNPYRHDSYRNDGMRTMQFK
jgi:hypothetical protein